MTDINTLQNELTRLHISIPDDLRLSDHTISRYLATQQRAGYVFFHTHMAVCHIDLYRFALPGARDPASIEILRKLPREFLAKSQKQAVAHSICLARFCDAVKKEMDKQPSRDNLGVVGDYTIADMATQSIRVLLIAVQFNLYQNLVEHTTAPLWGNGPITEAQIRALIDSLIEITEAWSHVCSITKQAVCPPPPMYNFS